MKIKLILLTTAVVASLTGASVRAADDPTNSTQNAASNQNQPPPETLFHNNEFNFDLFGTYINPERHLSKLFDTNIRRGSWGGGVGVNYFPICFVGLGVDTAFQTGARNYPDHVAGNFILRLPIEPAHLAPYVFGGGGRQFDPQAVWFGDFGIGLDVRFTRCVGIFGDARYIWTDKGVNRFAQDAILFRTGLRIAF